MKENICLIGPFPPPINGNTKALDTIVKSDKVNEKFNIHKVNLSGSQVGMSGKFTFQKVKTLKNAITDLKKIQSNYSIDTYYLTIAQSTFGCLRDVALIHQILKNKNNAKIVLHLHGGGFGKFYHNSHRFIKGLIKKYYSKADNLIVLSDSLKLMFNGIIDEKKVIVIENCVDNEYLLPGSLVDKKIETLNNKTTLQLVYLSNLIKTKGYLDLLLSAKVLKEKQMNFKIQFAGNFVSNIQKEEFYNYINENDLNSNVEYVGVVNGNEKKSLLLNGNIFVLPTYYPQEGQPISILEAMSAGMPIITTRHGGIPDVIKHGKNGLFVEAKNIEEISETIIKLLNNPKLMVEIGKNNRKKIMDYYLESHYIDKIIKVLFIKGV